MTNKIRSSTLENASVLALLVLALGAPACSTHLDDGKSGETHFLCKTDADCTRHFGNDDYLCGEANYCVPTRDGGSSGAGGGAGATGEGGGAGTGGDRGTGAGGENRGGAAGGISGNGGACICTAQACGPNTHSVTTPGECCPHCEPCGLVLCPSLTCAPGTPTVTLPGQCCATCMYTGPTCTQGFRPEACHENDLPRCATNWAEAMDRYSTLWCGEANVTLAHCGNYYMLTTANDGGQNVYYQDSYYYDASGTMVGSSGSNSMGEYCTAYTPSFMVPSDPPCALVNAACSRRDSGIDCGNGIVDIGEECDGLAIPTTCAAVTMALHPVGALKCTSTCHLDSSGCHS